VPISRQNTLKIRILGGLLFTCGLTLLSACEEGCVGFATNLECCCQCVFSLPRCRREMNSHGQRNLIRPHCLFRASCKPILSFLPRECGYIVRLVTLNFVSVVLLGVARRAADFCGAGEEDIADYCSPCEEFTRRMIRPPCFVVQATS